MVRPSLTTGLDGLGVRGRGESFFPCSVFCAAREVTGKAVVLPASLNALGLGSPSLWVKPEGADIFEASSAQQVLF